MVVTVRPKVTLTLRQISELTHYSSPWSSGPHRLTSETKAIKVSSIDFRQMSSLRRVDLRNELDPFQRSKTEDSRYAYRDVGPCLFNDWGRTK